MKGDGHVGGKFLLISNGSVPYYDRSSFTEKKFTMILKARNKAEMETSGNVPNLATNCNRDHANISTPVSNNTNGYGNILCVPKMPLQW